MILKAKYNKNEMGISMNHLYPVIGYSKCDKTELTEYCIYDHGFISWITIDYFIVISDSVKNYTKTLNEDSIKYFYYGIDQKLIDNIYLENEQSTDSIFTLETILSDIIYDEMTINDITNSIIESGFKGDAIEFQLKAFFRKASKNDIINLSKMIFNNISDLDSYIMEMLVENLKKHNEFEVECLLTNIYVSPACSEETRIIIDDYLS